VLGDFGIAWEFQSDSAPYARSTRGCVGTPEFCSPEVLCGNYYSFEADLWAFGVILYEMLSDWVRAVIFSLISFLTQPSESVSKQYCPV
jgi:serine/threonine protein kinase